MSGKSNKCRCQPRRFLVDPCSKERDVARGVVRYSPQPENRPTFLPLERDRDFLSSVFYTSAPKCICTGRLAGARHESPAVMSTLRSEDGSEPRMIARGSDFTTQSLVLLIEVCRGLGISPRPSKHGPVCRRQILYNICPGNIFFVFCSKFGTCFVKICAHSERYRNRMEGIFFN